MWGLTVPTIIMIVSFSSLPFHAPLCFFADNSETNEDGALDEEEAATARETSADQEAVAEEWGRFLHIRDKVNYI